MEFDGLRLKPQIFDDLIDEDYGLEFRLVRTGEQWTLEQSRDESVRLYKRKLYCVFWDKSPDFTTMETRGWAGGTKGLGLHP